MAPKHIGMKSSRIIQFAVAAVLVSIGCGLLLAGAATVFATICFCLPSIVLLRRAEMSRPLPARELWITVGVLALLVTFIVLANHFIPRSSGEHFVRQPVVVGAFWVVAMVALFWSLRRERRLTDASYKGSGGKH